MCRHDRLPLILPDRFLEKVLPHNGNDCPHNKNDLPHNDNVLPRTNKVPPRTKVVFPRTEKVLPRTEVVPPRILFILICHENDFPKALFYLLCRICALPSRVLIFPLQINVFLFIDIFIPGDDLVLNPSSTIAFMKTLPPGDGAPGYQVFFLRGPSRSSRLFDNLV